MLRQPQRAGQGSARRTGATPLFDIDWQGTQQLESAFRDDLVRIFILPPSMAELERRLHERGTDSDEVIAGPHEAGGQRDQPLGRI